MPFSQPCLRSLRQLSILPLSLLLGLGVIKPLSSTAGETKQSSTQVSAVNPTLNNGIYLYGRSSQPQEIGQEYLVFKVEQGQVKGAIYFPHSEFNCFLGTLNPRQMDLAIIDPHSGNQYPYSISLQPTGSVASNNQLPEFGLAGYYRLNEISDIDRQMLQTCLS